jgi:hypothetical protein
MAVGKLRESLDRWKAFVVFGGQALANRVALELCYPLVDVNALEQNHGQIKCPFSLHMTTGRVALPLNDRDFDTFDPANAPSLNDSKELLAQRLKNGRDHLEQWLDVNAYSE